MLLAQREEATFQRGAQERTLAVLTAVDAELTSSRNVLNSLATSHNRDWRICGRFTPRPRGCWPASLIGSTVILALPSARQLVNALLPFGAELPDTVERRSFDDVVQTRHAGVGYLSLGAITERGTVTSEHAFPIRVRVIRNGEVKYVLSAVVKPRAITALLGAQRLPSD